MIEIIKAIVYGIVEGITEWLPISSTGHMILLKEILPMQVSQQFWDVFLVVIQLGAILAVVLLFFHEIWPFDFRKHYGSSLVRMDVLGLWGKILVACVPAAVVGLLFDDQLEVLLNSVVVSIMLILFGIAFILIENYNRRRKPAITSVSQITIKVALMIGVFQLIAAVFPGTSRSGATIVGALLIGVSRTAAAEFTFYLAVPVMFGASLLKMVKYFLDYGTGFTGPEWAVLLVGTAAAFLVSILVIRFLLGYIRKHDFKIFGWYRIVLGVIVLIFFIV